jgi:hypothetical protein
MLKLIYFKMNQDWDKSQRIEKVFFWKDLRFELKTQFITRRSPCFKQKAPRLRGAFILWCLQESNQGHMDFQSIALPTELRHQPLRRQKYEYFGLVCNYSRKI